MTETVDASGDDGYAGLLSAYLYVLRRTESTLLRTYVVASALLALAVAALWLAALAVWFVSTLGQSPLVTVSNAFLGVIALFVLIPLVAPVVLAARRHHRDPDAPTRRDFLLALSGYLFVFSLYVGLVITVPAGSEYEQSTGAVATFLYGLPQLAGIVPPLVAAALVWAVHRAT